MANRVLMVATAVAGGIASLFAYLLAWPVPVQPVVWDAPEPVDWTPTGSLASVERHDLPSGHGPEDVHIADDGTVYVGTDDGSLWAYPTDSEPFVLANTGGRPLGLHGLPDGRIAVGDAFKGLLAVDADTGDIETLATTCSGRRMLFTDDLEVSDDGTLWFSDVTERFDQSEWTLDIIESGTTGRLCALGPDDSEPHEVLTGLAFANGVAVDPGGQFVLVNETSRYRVRRYWLMGLRAGEDDVLIDNLPGFPDGISTGQGRFWIAIASPRNPLIDAASGRPWLRKLLVRLPEFLHPAPERTARAIGVDVNGEVLHDLFDPTGATFTTVTSVQEYDGRLYLGSLVDTAWAAVPAP